MVVPQVKIERVKRGLRQEDVAALTKGKIPQHRLSQIERGVFPRPEEAKILATVFNVSADELFPA